MKCCLSTIIIFTSLTTLSACGGGSGSTEFLSGIPISCSVTETVDGDTITVKAGSEGSIGVDCNADEDGFFLKNSIPSLNIENVTRTLTISAQCVNFGSLTIVGALDYKTGIYDVAVTNPDGTSFNCKTTYDPANLPTTIGSKKSITQLLSNYAIDPTLQTSSTCPPNIPTSIDSNLGCPTRLTGTFGLLYNITDETNEHHDIVINLDVK